GGGGGGGGGGRGGGGGLEGGGVARAGRCGRRRRRRRRPHDGALHRRGRGPFLIGNRHVDACSNAVGERLARDGRRALDPGRDRCGVSSGALAPPTHRREHDRTNRRRRSRGGWRR